MKKSTNRILSLFLAVLCFLCFTGVNAFAENSGAGDIIILYTNDVHCNIDGYTALAGYRAELLGQGHKVITVDAGDAIQGEIIGALTTGFAIADIMNNVGYDLAVPGNHEFDYGMDNFLELAAEQANYQYISANFIDIRTDDTVFDPYVICEANGEKVAVLGLCTPESYTKSTPTYFQDEKGNYIYSFCENDFYEVIQEAVNDAKADGATKVIAVGHLGIDGTTEGWKSTDVIANTEGIDAFIDAHAHQTIASEQYEDKNGDAVILSSTGTKFANIGKLTIDADGNIATELVSLDSIDVTKLSPEAQEKASQVQALLDGYNDELAYLYEELGTTDAYLTLNDAEGNWIIREAETNMGDFVADAYKTFTGADVALANSGGIRAELPVGTVTRKALMDINPWSNSMCVIKASGQQILDALEHGVRKYPETSGGFPQVAGITYEIHAWKETPVSTDDKDNFLSIDDTMERRIANVKINGNDIDPEKLYTVAASQYMLLSGGDGYTMFKDCEIVTTDLPADADILVQYFTDILGGHITEDMYGEVEGHGRITILTEAPTETPPTETPPTEENPATGNNGTLTIMLPAAALIALSLVAKRKKYCK